MGVQIGPVPDWPRLTAYADTPYGDKASLLVVRESTDFSLRDYGGVAVARVELCGTNVITGRRPSVFHGSPSPLRPSGGF